ncbi:hypothetical protein [Streptomyces asoensis]|uniref:hypothetical protein n=1 Tax=Streptomyces asoensis TaxID=249586 RepID=UPI0034001784
MTARPVRSKRGGPGAAPVMGVCDAPFKSPLVKAVFRDVTAMHVSRSAAWAAASVTRTVVAGVVDGARRVAAEEGRKRLVAGDLLAAIDRDVELEVGSTWYDHSPTFRGLTGVLYDAGGVVVPTPRRGGSRKAGAVVGAHRFEAGVRKVLRGHGVTAVPAMVRDLDGIASVFLTDLARDAAGVVREGGAARFGAVTLVMPGEPASPLLRKDSFRARPARRGDGRTIGRDDVLAAARVRLSGGRLGQRALTEARAAMPVAPAQ